MRYFKTLATTLMLIVVLSTIAAATASAENPEILPVPTAAAPLKYTFTSGKGKLETTALRTLECEKDKGSGEFTSQDKGGLVVDVEGCKEPKSGAKCNSSGDEPGIVLLSKGEVTGTLVDYKSGAELLLGFNAKIEKDIIFKCGVLQIEVLGDGLAKVDGVKTLVKTKTAEILFHQTDGEQEIKTCELLKAFCGTATLTFLANFGTKEELLGLDSEEKVAFVGPKGEAIEAEVHF